MAESQLPRLSKQQLRMLEKLRHVLTDEEFDKLRIAALNLLVEPKDEPSDLYLDEQEEEKTLPQLLDEVLTKNLNKEK